MTPQQKKVLLLDTDPDEKPKPEPVADPLPAVQMIDLKMKPRAAD